MWLVHADLHESRVIASIEYLSTTVIYVEPQLQLPSESKVLNLRRGRIRVRTKKRNGRVREQVEARTIYIYIHKFPQIAQEDVDFNVFTILFYFIFRI